MGRISPRRDTPQNQKNFSYPTTTFSTQHKRTHNDILRFLSAFNRLTPMSVTLQKIAKTARRLLQRHAV